MCKEIKVCPERSLQCPVSIPTPNVLCIPVYVFTCALYIFMYNMYVRVDSTFMYSAFRANLEHLRTQRTCVCRYHGLDLRALRMIAACLKLSKPGKVCRVYRCPQVFVDAAVDGNTFHAVE